MRSFIRLGIVIANCAYVTVQREKSISVTPYDMNVLLITLFARPAIRQTDASVPVCLPGVADDGYLSLAIKYVTPNICVIFATLNAEDHPECMARANDVARILETRGLVFEITKSLRDNFLRRSPVVPSSKRSHRGSRRVRDRRDIGSGEEQQQWTDMHFQRSCVRPHQGTQTHFKEASGRLYEVRRAGSRSEEL